MRGMRPLRRLAPPIMPPQPGLPPGGSVIFFAATLDASTLEIADRWPHELIRIQPEEAITLKINNKFPGLGLKIDQSKLDLQYKQVTDIPIHSDRIEWMDGKSEWKWDWLGWC